MLELCPHLDSNQGPADYEGDLGRRRSETFLGRRLFSCPPVPPVSTVSTLLRRVCVEFGSVSAAAVRASRRNRAVTNLSATARWNWVSTDRLGWWDRAAAGPRTPMGAAHRGQKRLSIWGTPRFAQTTSITAETFAAVTRGAE